MCEFREVTPPTFFHDIETHHKAHKKARADAQEKGDAKDTAANPVNVALHKKLLEWALNENDMFAWHWTKHQ